MKWKQFVKVDWWEDEACAYSIQWVVWCWRKPIWIGLPLVWLAVPMMAVDIVYIVAIGLSGLSAWSKHR